MSFFEHILLCTNSVALGHWTGWTSTLPVPKHCVVYSTASPHFSSFTSSAEVKRKGICQLLNHTTQPVPTQQPTVDAPRLTCCAAIVQVHKGCPLSLFIPPHSLGLLDSGLPCSSFGESRNKKRDNRDLVSHPRSVKSLVPPLAPEQCFPCSLTLHTHNGVRILRSRATPD